MVYRIYRHSENGLDGVTIFAGGGGVRVGVTHLDKISTCLLSKTAARAMAKRIVELVGDEPQSKPKIKTFEKKQIVFLLRNGERLSVIGDYSTCIPEADMGEYRINDIEGDTLLVKCSEVVAIQEHSLCPIEEDQEDEA
jgi:superfamily I DNA/RNA helicase